MHVCKRSKLDLAIAGYQQLPCTYPNFAPFMLTETNQKGQKWMETGATRQSPAAEERLWYRDLALCF